MSAYNFKSSSDVDPAFSGYLDWEYIGAASFEGLCRFVWEHHTDNKYGSCADCAAHARALAHDYLVSVGENPNDYGV